ncbi:hypothetical protein PG995_005360 [Apiospora arundinis]
MFRQRSSSQKPGDDLLANFRQQFPVVVPGQASTTAPAQSTTAADHSSLPGGIHHVGGHGLVHEAFQDHDPTPRATAERWRFTLSLLDPSSFSFATFANQPPSYCTLTPGGTNTIYHPQAGDLHAPTLGLGMGLGTPLSLPTSEGGMHSGARPMMDMSSFHHAIQPHQFQPFNPLIQPAPAQSSFAPSSFIHQNTGYESMDHDGPPLKSDAKERMGSLDPNFHSQSPPMMGFQPRHFGLPMSHALPTSAEKFRFHVTLNAPTAMIKHADEIPVTYLNKGQAYLLSVADTASTLPIIPGTRYRTFVRISFVDEQQRQKPGVCWSLLKERRGTNEAHQRGGKLQAVEYVDAGQPAEGDDKRARVELDAASFDGFSVVWTPGNNGTAECSLAVRFNFLSTDFSHSKGIKGIPVRLCAKTVMLGPYGSSPTSDADKEICFCKVKLFRDHGAERKLSNDAAHVKKSIYKVKQQVAQAESGMKDFGKRKRGGASQVKAQESPRPGKTPKHKRTWSMSSASSTGSVGGGGRPPLEEDFHFKLQTLQDMLTSTRPVSVLYQRGEETGDPDLHPVSIAGESTNLTKVVSKDNWQIRSGRSSAANSLLVSPSPSSMSLQSQASAAGGPAPWNELQRTKSRSPGRRLSDQHTKVNKVDESGNISGWIEALGVDPTYKAPPPERQTKPIACFYVARNDALTANQEKCYRAVYLSKRTLEEFVARVAAKWALDASKVVRVVHVLGSLLPVEPVEVDDDVIREMPEGQDMTLDVAEDKTSVPQPKREWEMAVDSPDEGEASSAHSVLRTTSGYELRLTF